jgi:uncharacterized cupin superfamily protein
MPDVTVRRIDEMDSLGGAGRFIRCRAELGVRSFGLQVLDLPPNDANHPEHDHENMPPPREFANDGQEEVYIPLTGSVLIQAGGQEYRLEPGMMARVGAGQMRKLLTREEPVRLLIIGGIPGKPYSAPAFSELED